MYIRNGLCNQGDPQNDDDGYPKQDHGKVKIVNSTNDIRTVAGLYTAASSIAKLRKHPSQSNQQPNDQAPKGSL